MPAQSCVVSESFLPRGSYHPLGVRILGCWTAPWDRASCGLEHLSILLVSAPFKHSLETGRKKAHFSVLFDIWRKLIQPFEACSQARPPASNTPSDLVPAPLSFHRLFSFGIHCFYILRNCCRPGPVGISDCVFLFYTGQSASCKEHPFGTDLQDTARSTLSGAFKGILLDGFPF